MGKKLVISIACEGAATVGLDEFYPFQGELKTLTDESYERGKRSIINLGFSFPMNAWRHGKKIYIIDAHQRHLILSKMRDEGYEIPKLPTNWIHAKDKREAAKKVLAAASQFGQITPGGLNSFIKEFEIPMDQLSFDFKLPDFNMPAFMDSYGSKTKKEVKFTTGSGAKEISSEDFTKFEHECPKCRFQWND